jgi:hypothetical protein
MSYKYGEFFKLSRDQYREWICRSLESYFLFKKGIDSFIPVEHLVQNGDIANFLSKLYLQLQGEYKYNFKQAIPLVLDDLGAKNELIDAYLELFEFIEKNKFYNCIGNMIDKMRSSEFNNDIDDQYQNIFYNGLSIITKLIHVPGKFLSKDRRAANKVIKGALIDIYTSDIFKQKYHLYAPRVLLSLCHVDKALCSKYIKDLEKDVFRYFSHYSDNEKENECEYDSFIKKVGMIIGNNQSDKIIILTYEQAKNNYGESSNLFINLFDKVKIKIKRISLLAAIKGSSHTIQQSVIDAIEII